MVLKVENEFGQNFFRLVFRFDMCLTAYELRRTTVNISQEYQGSVKNSVNAVLTAGNFGIDLCSLLGNRGTHSMLSEERWNQPR